MKHHPPKAPPTIVIPLLLAAAIVGACRAAPPEPTNDGAAVAVLSAAAPPPAAAKPAGDPAQGKFSLADATAGLPGDGPLLATITTDKGALECRLFADKAPITVANFVGLARGLRPFRAAGGEWVKRPGYDGSVFHRIVKGFMIQGGDWQKTGRGDAGYVFPDEVWAGAKHDRRGLLCMANKGPNTNAMQFFITDGPAPHLDRGYTIFGECGPEAVIETLASVPVRGESPVQPPVIQRVTISRAATP